MLDPPSRGRARHEGQVDDQGGAVPCSFSAAERWSRSAADACADSQAGNTALPRPGSARPPHLHDLRHLFAISTVTSWYRAGLDVNAQLPLLSTFLGHADPANSYWYLSATPELLALAAGRRQHARSEKR